MVEKQWTRADPTPRDTPLFCEFGWWSDDGVNLTVTIGREVGCRKPAIWQREDISLQLNADGSIGPNFARYLCDEHLPTHFNPKPPILQSLESALERLERI